MHVIVFSGSIVGIDGLVVEVEVDLARGLPCFSIVGLPNAAVRESRERVTAAIKNTGLKFPLDRITVNLAPADIKKEGAAFDLAVATGIAIASAAEGAAGGGSSARLSDALLLGELALDGTLRPVRGVLPLLIHARQNGFRRAVIPYDNFTESRLVAGIEVLAVRRLGDVLALLPEIATGLGELFAHGGSADPDIRRKAFDEVGRSAVMCGSAEDAGLDMADVIGQESVKRALTIAAAGGHHALLLGPPGAGKTMLARRFPAVLPPLDEEAALETTMIYSIAGQLDGGGLVRVSPFRAPHHSASDAGLIGGGNVPRPGEVTLAHNGVLFLDEFPEFKRHVLETLREPIELGRIAISRARSTVVFPARFQLIAAMNPCPCGHLGDNQRPCRCTPDQIRRYLGKVSGPLLDRIGIHALVRPVEIDAFSGKTSGETTASIRERVLRARAVARRRLGEDERLVPNARLPEALVRRFCRLGREAEVLLAAAQRRLGVSARGRGHVIRVARTIADLEEAGEIVASHVAEAVQYRMREIRG